MTETIQRIVLASRPVGEPTLDNFRSEKFPIPHAGPGKMLLRTLWLSLDPYMRGRMSDAPSYAKPVGIGDVMEGGTVSGQTLGVWDAAVRGSVADATADAAMTELEPSNRRRLISIFPTAHGAPRFLSSLIVSSGGVRQFKPSTGVVHRRSAVRRKS